MENRGEASARDLLSRRNAFAAAFASDSPSWFVVQKLGILLADASQDLDSDVLRRFRYDWNRWLDELPAPTPAELVAYIRVVARQKHFVELEEFEAARIRLQQEVSRIEARLRSSPEDQGWMEYLQIPQLQAATGSRESVIRLWPTVDQLPERFRIGAVAWPTQDLVDAARSLERFAAMARVEADADFDEARKTRLARLARLLEDLQKEENEQPPSEIAEICHWLQARNADMALVAGVHCRFLHPNLVLFVSNRELANRLETPFDEEFPVNDVIAGTRVRGRGRMTGKTQCRFVPSVDQGILEFSLDGKTVTSTVGLADSATIRSTGVTDVQGVKRVEIDVSGLRRFPANVTASTRISYDSVSVSRPLVRQQILNRVYASRPRAESDSARATSAFIRSEMNDRIDPLIASTNERLRDSVILPLTRHLVWPQTHAIQSGPDGLFIELSQRQPAQFGAPVPAPMPASSGGAQLMVHSSFAERLFSSLVHGKTVDGADFQQALQPQTALTPAPEADDSWSVTFEESRPVSVSFHD
ncbi:MAG: hypothetical protein JJ992_28615, partial [Planctomycetes bacterium]|nr:hypothetical protein [Planctomycetota bacterium]